MNLRNRVVLGIRAGRRLVAAMAAVGLLATGCGSSAPDRGDVLVDLADEHVIPAYERLDEAAADLVVAADAVCREVGTATIAAANDALSEVRAAWLASEAMWFGPVMERRSWAVVDFPISPEEIEALIADESITLDFDRLYRRIGADQRGLQAVEYILGPPDAPPVGELDSPRRCGYLVGISEVIAAEVALLPDDWAVSWEEGPAYREIVGDVEAGALDALVNDALFLLEAITDAELGTGLGLMEAPADPEAIIEGPAGLGVVDIASRVEGLRAVLVGDDAGSGIAPLLPSDLVDRIRSGLDRADAALADLDGPLRARLVDSPAEVAEIRDALSEVQVLVVTEVVAALGVTIGFSDADGDSG